MSEAVADSQAESRLGPPAASPRPPSPRIAPGTPSPNEITDVWSWRARKYRIRATVLLLVNFALFCALCTFSHWMHAGKVFDFDLGSYLAPFRFWGPQTHNLTHFVLFPISVARTPVYGIVLGLLVASMVAVPISVAIIYRFRSALPFIAAVGVFAHMPWLAITLLASCILAAVRPFRFPFRYGSALLGMLPVLLYLYLSTRGTPETLTGSISPERKLLLAGPWLLAILAACTMMAVIIFIARVVNYRPGAVAPVMSIMFATPVILFYTHVGVDKLQYRVLESRFGPRAERFEPVQDAAGRILDLLHEWTRPASDREPLRAALLAVWNARPEDVDALKRRIARPLVLALLADRRDAYEACTDFIADHPASRYVPNVLFILGRVLDTRLDERKLMGSEAQRELYSDFPHVQSEPVWTNLASQYPDSPLAVAARLRVAQLRLRQGDADGALAALAAPAATPADPPTDSRPTVDPLLSTPPPEESLDFDPAPYLFETQRLRELILANRDDPKHSVRPLQELAALDPHRERYKDQLQQLAHRYADSLLSDNIAVRWASAHSDRQQRATQLRACLELYPAGDALPEALFQLADLEIHYFGSENPAQRTAGLARLRALVEQHANSCWAALAAERLRLIEPRPRPPIDAAETP